MFGANVKKIKSQLCFNSLSKTEKLSGRIVFRRSYQPLWMVRIPPWKAILPRSAHILQHQIFTLLISLRFASCSAMMCHAASCRVVSWRAMLCHAEPSRIMLCRVLSCRVVSRHVVSCRVAAIRCSPLFDSLSHQLRFGFCSASFRSVAFHLVPSRST